MTHPCNSAMPRARWLAILALCAAALSACSSSPPAHKAAQAATSQQSCNQVSGALADGPDPDADPVGYAEAQIKPLSQIHTADARLSAAVSKLDQAYKQLFDSNGKSSAAKQAVSMASKQVNSFCPGAAS